MKIQQTPNLRINSQQNNTPKSSKIAFEGAGDTFAQFLRFLDTNQAWGATAVDLGCMGIPRTTVDFTRGPDAGLETMRREFSSTADDAAIGAFGMGAAWLVSQGLNKKYGIRADKMFISDEMLDILSHTWNEKRNSKQPLEDYLNHLIGEAKAYNPDAIGADDHGYINIDNKTRKSLIEKFTQEIKNGPEKMSKETKAYFKSLITDSTGAQKRYKLEKTIGGKSRKAILSVDDLVDNIYKASKTFVKNGVAETFKNGNITENAFIKGLKKLNMRTSIIGLGIATGIGCSLQPLNMYLTKKKTGKSGFVGVEGREPDKSKGFKMLKLGVASAAALGVMRSIGKFSEILGKVQFKGLTPTIPQFKLVYGMTIMSRLLAARDKNELREASIKDSLGFVNWLILGGFVSKLTASAFEKMDRFKNDKFIKYNKAEDGASKFNWLTKSDIITRDEVLHSALKKAGVSTIENGKAMSFKRMMEIAKKVAPEARTKVKYLGFIQAAGYIYSGVVLGMGIPKLNIAITKSIQKKHQAKKLKEETTQTKAA